MVQPVTVELTKRRVFLEICISMFSTLHYREHYREHYIIVICSIIEWQFASFFRFVYQAICHLIRCFPYYIMHLRFSNFFHLLSNFILLLYLIALYFSKFISCLMTSITLFLFQFFGLSI